MHSEATIRLGSFALMLVVMGVTETVWPRRQLTTSKPRRWVSNLSISILSTIIARLALPLVPTGFALYCTQHGYGLFNLSSIPPVVAIITSVIFLDMVIYWQHVIFHRIPLLWRVHRMHHIDLDIDASTGIRFHPIEICLSLCLKLGTIFILGPPMLAVLIFEVLLNGCALFNHANVRIPITIDAAMRLLMVTPDMHRVHHSTDMREANMNFGFNFPWWDRIFGTYKAQPDKGHNGMTIGLNIFRTPRYGSILNLLRIPFL
ncbi:sterol desaturase family protein [Pseudodesulfovibrio sediminis]|uniref:Sterol desaturase n=1 Tax=Pseudodesulfovibrio sediminis TaxID=2810563 RepID=A0ABM7P3L7_9BACT|nr:sterol desaturase family protein [Pseudodesulfovibrio sediminis]BCS87423.1 sterol desaturase [Pseudodesulfovibrio sediminis]